MTLIPRIVSLTNWLEDNNNLYVKLIRNPVGIGFPDEDNPDTKIQVVQETIRVGELHRVLREHIEENLWRSWQLFSDESCTNAVSYVPLIIDIDNEEHNLDDAHELTRVCLDWFEETNQFASLNNLRVVFSGKKGFHIEARPTKLEDNHLIRESLLEALEGMGIENRGASNYFLKGTIDLCHDFVRLTGSFNSWKENQVLVKRKAIQFTVDSFRILTVKDILKMCEA